MPGKKLWRMFLAALLLAGALPMHTTAEAQSGNAAHAAKNSSDAAKKEVRFEVVSIRPVNPEWSPYDGSPLPLSNGMPSPNGYQARVTIWQLLMIAYAPGGMDSWGSTPVLNPPKWSGDWYDVQGHISDSDLTAWKNQGDNRDLLRSALKAVLKDRFKLAIHEQPTDIPDYKLVVGKNGPKLAATAPGSALPKGVSLKSGGVMVGETRDRLTQWNYHGATMEDLALFLTRISQERPVRDETRLTGRYDFTIQQLEAHPSDNEHPLENWPISHLGLELKPGKTSGFKLVIDHIEKPTAN